MVTKAKKALLASLAAFLCVMLTVFGLSMSVSLSETAKAADETSAVAKVGVTTYETLKGAIDAAKEGETVTLRMNTTEDVVVDKNITLDLGDKTLTGTNTGNATLTIAKGATATVKNGSVIGTSSFYNIQNNGTATFETLTATAGNTGSSMIDNWGTLTITSGVYSGGLNTVKSEEGTTLTITGGKFVSDYAPKSGITGTILVYGTTTISGGEFIQNSTSTSARVVVTGLVEGYTSITNVTGGSFTTKSTGAIFHNLGKATPDNFEVSGGTFNKSIPYYYFAEGSVLSKNSSGSYGVRDGKYVAGVGTTGYETLEAAIKATKKGTIKLLDNINGNFEIASAKNITLDLNGFTLDGGTGTAKAAITNYGTLTIKDSSAAKTGTIKRDDNGVEGETSYYVIRNLGTMTIKQANIVNNSGYRKTNPSGSMIGSSLICNGDGENNEKASLTINGGKLTQLNFIAIKNGADGTLVVNGGEITSNHSAVQNWYNATITGGKITGQIWTDAWEESSIGKTVIDGTVEFTGEIVMDITGSVKPTLEITGGTLDVTNWRITTACAKLGGKPAVSGGTFANAVPAEYCADRFIPTKNADGTYGVKACVAKVGSTKYETLAEAIAAAKAGDTITLLADITNTDYTVANVINIKLAEGVTLDGNNHTLSGNVKITVASAGGVTIKNVKFKDIHNAAVVSDAYKTKYGFSDDKVGTLSAIYASNLNGSLTVTGCEFENVDWDAMQITPATGAEVVIKNNIFKVSESETVKEQLRHVHVEMAYGGGVDYEGTDIVLTVTDNQFIAETKEASLGVWWVGKDSTLDLTGNYYADPDSASITLSDKSFNRENRVDLIYPARSTADVDEDNLTATVMLIKDAFNSATYSTLAEAIAAAKDGETVKLLADCSGDGIVVAANKFTDKGLIVDFGGYTYTIGGVLVGSSGTKSNGFQLLIGNKITFRNGGIVGDKATAGDDKTDWTGAAAIMIQNYCDLTLEKMVISGGEETVYTMSNNNGDVVIEDTTINAGKAKGYTSPAFAFDVCRYSSYTSVSVTVRGNSVINGNIEISGAIGEGQSRQLNVENGTFNGTFNVSGNVPANIAISGGTFKYAVPAKYCAEGFIPQDNGDGTFGVKVGTYVAEVKGVKYETLQEAIDAAARNATVTLLADTRANVTIAKALTLDLNGYTINGGTEKGKPAVTVTQRIVTIKDSSAAQTGTIMREDTAGNSGVSSHYVIDVQGNGWLTFESGNVKNNSGAGGTKGASLVRVGDDSVAKYPGLNIKGGTFTQNNFIVIKIDRGDLFLNGGTLNSANTYAIENWKRATVKGGTVNGAVSSWTYPGGSNSELTISGGTINGDVTSVNYGNATDKKATVSVTGGTIKGELDTRSYDPATGKLTSINDAAKATIEVSGGTFTNTVPADYCAEGFIPTKNADGTFGVEKTEKVYLAKVGETSYCTMEEAFEAQTASGEAIVLLRDYTTGSTFNSGTKHRVVDLNGHTWTYTGSDADCAAFEINNPNATLTVKNGTIISNSLVGLIPTANSMSGTILYSGSSLVFEGVTMTANGHSGIETNGGNENVNVTLTNCTLNVPNGFGIYFPSSGTLTIDNSKITANTMGVQVCSGTLNINAGSAITVTGDAVPKTENDGAIQDGAAISIVNRPGYKGLSNIVITGGTFTAKAGNDAIKAYDWNNAEKTESAFTKADLVAVSGGTFSSEVKKDYLAKGYRLTKTGESYGVTAKYIESTHVSLGTALSFSYKLRALKEGETIKNAKASYRTVRGNLVEIDMTLVDGYYVFDGITPQMLDRKISVNVYVGDTVVYDVVDYSIIDYLQDLLNTHLGKATVTKQLVADLAFYGKAAMKYVGYTTTVVDKFIANNGLTQSTGEMTGVVTSSGTEKVANVSVQFASQNKILIGVAESVFNDYSYTIKVNGTKIDKALWQTDVVDGYRVYVSDGFAASYITDKDHYVEVEVLKNEVSVQKVQCNVAGYCMKMAENAKMGELAKATYYYGVSAAKYVAIIKG